MGEDGHQTTQYWLSDSVKWFNGEDGVYTTLDVPRIARLRDGGDLGGQQQHLGSNCHGRQQEYWAPAILRSRRNDSIRSRNAFDFDTNEVRSTSSTQDTRNFP
jgi:hypothetical protein